MTKQTSKHVLFELVTAAAVITTILTVAVLIHWWAADLQIRWLSAALVITSPLLWVYALRDYRSDAEPAYANAFSRGVLLNWTPRRGLRAGILVKTVRILSNRIRERGIACRRS